MKTTKKNPHTNSETKPTNEEQNQNQNQAPKHHPSEKKKNRNNNKTFLKQETVVVSGQLIFFTLSSKGFSFLSFTLLVFLPLFVTAENESGLISL